MERVNKVLKNLTIFICYFIVNYILASSLNNSSLYLIIQGLFYILFLIFIYRKELIIDFKKIKFINILKYIPIYILGIIIMYLSNKLISNITNINISSNEAIIRKYIKLFPVYMCFNTVIYAPFVEEITFRKTFKNIFNNKYLFIIISGIIFGLAHISFSNNMFNEFLMTIPYILMGINLSYIYYKSDNIFTTIIIHSIHNLILLIVQFIGG